MIAIKLGGVLEEIDRVPSGGENPLDVAVGHEDYVIAANHDSNAVTVFAMDRHGRMHQIGAQDVGGVHPHIVSIGPTGVVAVANDASNDLTILDLDHKGHLSVVDPSLPLGSSPKALAFGGRELFVGTRSTPGVQDQIRAYRPLPGGGFEEAGSTDAGFFLTETGGPPPSFKQLSTARGRDESVRLFVSEFQSSRLRSITFQPA